jgi:hypothetical protein
MASNKIQMKYRIKEVVGGSFEVSVGIRIGIFIPFFHYGSFLSLVSAEKFIYDLKSKKKTYYR